MPEELVAGGLCFVVMIIAVVSIVLLAATMRSSQISREEENDQE